MPTSPEAQTYPGHCLFPGSRRVYLPGSRRDLQVPMREIALSPTRLPNGTEVPNEPVRVYDTAGAWGDPAFHADPTKGLPPVRAASPFRSPAPMLCCWPAWERSTSSSAVVTRSARSERFPFKKRRRVFSSPFLLSSAGRGFSPNPAATQKDLR